MNQVELAAWIARMEHEVARQGARGLMAPLAQLGRAVVANSERLDKLERGER